MAKIDKILIEMDKLTLDDDDLCCDRALYLLLREHRQSLPHIPDDYPDWGMYFQKAFRQMDIITTNTDVAIWLLLSGTEAFWQSVTAVEDAKANDGE